MKLTTVHYLGFTAMDRRFSNPMLPWIVSEIRKRDSYEQLSMGFEDSTLQSYNTDFELQFVHKISNITRFSQADSDPCTFLYLLRDESENLLYCYLFQAIKSTDVADLYHQMREHGATTPTRSLSSAANLSSLCVDISPSSSHFFEVLYIGKIKVSHRKVPDTFIDDALDKFKAHEADKQRTKLANLGDIRRASQDSNASEGLSMEALPVSPVAPIVVLSSSDDSTISNVSSTVSESSSDAQIQLKSSMTEPVPQSEHNRTMVLQVGRTDLRLISPDRKLVLLHKQHRDLAVCLQGLKNPEHFGFVCREHPHLQQPQNVTFIGYIFKCESPSVSQDTVNAISQAFANNTTEQRATPTRAVISSCEHCPMMWYHRLCSDLENLSDRKIQALIFRRIDNLDESEQNVILTKFRGAETDSVRDQNEFLMMLLRAHCEMKQSRHIHDSAENRSEFLTQYLGNASVFSKAKRSLSNSFDHLLKRKGSRDDFGEQIVNRELSLPIDSSDNESSSSRSRSSTIGSVSELKPLKSPMMDIFMKLGTPQKQTDSPIRASWRQAMYNRVVTPTKQQDPPVVRNREELRALWKRSIHQAILLVRMERENAKLRARQELSATKRAKLEYDEISTTATSAETWDVFFASKRSDPHLIAQALKSGIPRAKRGESWRYLADLHSEKTPPGELSERYTTPYDKLLTQLTSHQHAILIDLGRTFPGHPYFSVPLGSGQLALFNLLKAYSLLDPEVGYCQGLSFVAGVLLLHCEEAEAFTLLKYLMFKREMRKQYLPDMGALQVRLYQLSRLMRDRLGDLYEHFDAHDVAPTLYAAPWLLTVFASQFPLGFVSRIFDLVFFEGQDAVVKVALALLAHNEAKLLVCASFEEIMNCLKSELVNVSADALDKIVREVLSVDLTRQLREYLVEYQVLQEEMQAIAPQLESLEKFKCENRSLTEQNRALSSQLEMAVHNVQRLEKTRVLQQNALNRLEMQSRALEVSVNTLGDFIEHIIERKVNIEIPGDVRRIVSQLSSKPIPTNNRHVMVKSLSTGRIGGTEDTLRVIRDDPPLKNNLGAKVSHFFSSTHSQILHNRLNQSDSKVKQVIREDSRENLPQNYEKTNSLPLDVGSAELISPDGSSDSGMGSTPLTSPRTTELKLPAELNSEQIHPLNCDDVSFTYNGTKKLRNIKPLRNLSRNSSPDLYTN